MYTLPCDYTVSYALEHVLIIVIFTHIFTHCTLDELREDSDKILFFSATYNPNHVLHRLLPQPKSIGDNLRQRTHNLTLPMEVNAVIKQNFVYRMLFRDIC